MLNSFKSFFIEDDKKAPTTAAPQVDAPVSQVTSQPTTDDPAFISALDSAINDKALSEFDYLKFMDSQRELASVVPDEKGRFRVAFVPVKKMGLTKDKLLDTAQYYITVIDEEWRVFSLAVEGQLKEKVEDSEKVIADLTAGLAEKQKQIDSLTAQVKSDLAKRQSLSTTVAEAKSKLTARKTGFETVCNRYREKIKKDMQNIKDYLE